MEKIVRRNDGLPVIIICHSYGCPFLHYFLTEKLPMAWKQRHIRGLIGMAGAWSGHFHAFYKYLSNEPYDLLSRLVPDIMEIERTWTSNLFLMPRSGQWGEQAVIRTRLRNYSADDVIRILRASNYMEPHFFDQMNSLSSTWGRFPAPGIDVHCIAGKGTATMAALVLDSDWWDAGQAAASKLETADGDGCLLLHTQKSCLLWKEETEAAGHVFSYQELELSHMAMIQEERGISVMKRVIREMSSG